MNYGKSEHIGGGTQADVDTTELDLVTIDEQENLTDSQLSVYITFALGTHTSMEFRYYARHTVDGTWYELPYRNDGTGEISSVPTEATSSTPASFVDSMPLPACLAFKMTVKGVGGANGSATARIMSRDN